MSDPEQMHIHLGINERRPNDHRPVSEQFSEALTTVRSHFPDAQHGPAVAEPVTPDDADYPAYATLFNHVSQACYIDREFSVWLPLNQRQLMTAMLWGLGYRPTPDMIETEQQRQHAADSLR